MPGILKKLDSNWKGSESTRYPVGSKTEAMAREDRKKGAGAAHLNGAAYTNGGNGLANGNNFDRSTASLSAIDYDHGISTALSSMAGRLPPEIEHITAGYLPIGKLMTRLVQETFSGLTEVIDGMSDMRVQPSNGQALFNQVNHHINGNTARNLSDDNNTKKKMLLLNFAHESRAKFIKILVLWEWSRNVGAISKVIDLKVWLDNQIRIYDEVIFWMGNLKRMMDPAKMPSPDIRTALQVLKSGKASWLSDLGYIPPEPLSGQELMKGLRNINTLLTIRLNTVESIPIPFRNFSISSGRATFRVAEEFELELSIADEDPTSQFYLVDFRFLFLPSVLNLPDGSFRNEIEGKTNDVLKNQGLGGCFDFWHDLTLTHKLNILRQQAFEMVRGHWSEHINVENVHRSFVVQYWYNKPGAKSWIQLGLNSGRKRKGFSLPSDSPVPRIALRWFRNGKEVLDHRITMDLGELTMDGILRRVIAAHTNYIVKETGKKLRESLLYSSKALTLSRTVSTTEPSDCSLSVQLTSQKIVKVAQEPISGAIALIPASRLNSRAERELNSLTNPAVDVSARLSYLRCAAAQEEVDSRARFVGWEPLRSINPSRESVEQLFPKGTMKLGFFRRREWDPSWILAFTSSMAGDRWWVVEIGAPLDTAPSTPRLGLVLCSAYQIAAGGTQSLVLTPTYALLQKIESFGAGMISQNVDTRYLRKTNVRHILRPPMNQSTEIQMPELFIKLRPNHMPPTFQCPPSTVVPWVHEVIKLNYQGLDHTTHSAIHLASASTPAPIPHIKRLSAAISKEIAFHPSTGAFAFRLSTRVGQPSISALLTRLKAIERLISSLSILYAQHLRPTTLSLTQIDFTYSQYYAATLHFPTTATWHLTFPISNPHLRIQDFLTLTLNASPTGLQQTTSLLVATLPLLRALDIIESVHSVAGNLVILARSAEWYQLRYESPKGRFDIRLRMRRDELVWHVRDLEARDGKELEGMKSVGEGRGEGWKGVRGGVLAESVGVENLIKKIDELFRAAPVTEEDQDERDIEEVREVKKEVVVLD